MPYKIYINVNEKHYKGIIHKTNKIILNLLLRQSFQTIASPVPIIVIIANTFAFFPINLSQNAIS